MKVTRFTDGQRETENRAENGATVNVEHVKTRKNTSPPPSSNSESSGGSGSEESSESFSGSDGSEESCRKTEKKGRRKLEKEKSSSPESSESARLCLEGKRAEAVSDSRPWGLEGTTTGDAVLFIGKSRKCERVRVQRQRSSRSTEHGVFRGKPETWLANNEYALKSVASFAKPFPRPSM